MNVNRAPLARLESAGDGHPGDVDGGDLKDIEDTVQPGRVDVRHADSGANDREVVGNVQIAGGRGVFVGAAKGKVIGVIGPNAGAQISVGNRTLCKCATGKNEQA